MKKLMIPALLIAALAACTDATDKNSTPGKNDAVVVTESVGKKLFMGNCMQCHALKADRTGPALDGVVARWNNDTTKLYSFIKNSQKVIAADGPDSYTGKLFDKWYKTTMPSFSGLSDEDIHQILDYINKGVE